MCWESDSMPFALLIFGAVLLTAAVRNKQGDLFRLLKNDFTGPHNFVFWFASILAVGAIGYIPKFKPVSNAFLVLLVVVLFVSNRGFFTRFNEQIKSTESDSTALSGGLTSFQLPELPKLF
jgi:hypothetical protein